MSDEEKSSYENKRSRQLRDGRTSLEDVSRAKKNDVQKLNPELGDSRPVDFDSVRDTVGRKGYADSLYSNSIVFECRKNNLFYSCLQRRSGNFRVKRQVIKS